MSVPQEASVSLNESEAGTSPNHDVETKWPPSRTDEEPHVPNVNAPVAAGNDAHSTAHEEEETEEYPMQGELPAPAKQQATWRTRWKNVCGSDAALDALPVYEGNLSDLDAAHKSRAGRFLTKYPPLLFGILAVCIGIYVAEIVITKGALRADAPVWLLVPANNAISDTLINSPLHIAVLNEWWRIVSNMVLHFGLWHVLSNCIAAVALLPPLLRAHGNTRILVLLVLCAVAGNLVGMVGTPLDAKAGASSSLFGALGAYLFDCWQLRHVTPRFSTRFALMLLQMLVLVALSFAPGIDLLGHMGGLIFGLLSAWALLPRMSTAQQVAAQVDDAKYLARQICGSDEDWEWADLERERSLKLHLKLSAHRMTRSLRTRQTWLRLGWMSLLVGALVGIALWFHFGIGASMRSCINITVVDFRARDECMRFFPFTAKSIQ
ncbi:MAG: hypothetical protein MHM6MM_006233 [Cercozoa sp. M6MM]